MDLSQFNVRINSKVCEEIGQEAKKRGVDNGQIVEMMWSFFEEYKGKEEFLKMMSGKLDAEWKRVKDLTEERTGKLISDLEKREDEVRRKESVVLALKLIVEGLK